MPANSDAVALALADARRRLDNHPTRESSPRGVCVRCGFEGSLDALDSHARHCPRIDRAGLWWHFDACPYCGAPAGRPCRSLSDLATDPHADRPTHDWSPR
jgi:hypothetical protein